MSAIASHDDLAAALGGDAGALSRLLAGERSRVVRYAERHCAVHDVEDAVQETLLIASRQLRGLRALEAFNRWLFRIVKRECDRLKRAWRRHIFDYAPERPLEQPVQRPVDELRLDLLAALESLPAHYRAVVLLRDHRELTIDEIAAELALGREAVKARLHRARVLIREYLAP